MADESAELALEQTLRSAADGDGQAWQTLVHAYTRRVFGLLYRQCGDRELAEEITQATFVKIVVKLQDGSGYDERGRFEAWLFRIAMNKLRDEMRRRKRHATPMDMSPGSASDDQPNSWAAAQHSIVTRDPSSDDPAAAMSRQEQLDELRHAISQLGEADQQILQLRHTAGLSFAQIAETLDQPIGTVLARGHRALAKLKKLMVEQEQ